MKKIAIIILSLIMISSSGVSIRKSPIIHFQKNVEHDSVLTIPVVTYDFSSELEKAKQKKERNQKLKQGLISIKEKKIEAFKELDQKLVEAKNYLDTIKTDTIDSVCVKKRGFISREIFGNNQCKKWKEISKN